MCYTMLFLPAIACVSLSSFVSANLHDHGLVLLQTKAQIAQQDVRTHTSLEYDDGVNKPVDLARSGLAAEDVSSNRGILLRNLVKHGASICACAKCGSTGLWDWLYTKSFGYEFSDDKKRNTGDSVQDVERPGWHGLFKIAKSREDQARIMADEFTFALIRDPKERLVSAWKSKVACGEKKKFGTDVLARAKMVPELLKLWGHGDTGESCMSIDRFMQVLLSIHQEGRDHLLNGHFLPQNWGCFAHNPPAQWSQVADITSEDPFSSLARHMHYEDRPEHKHESTRSVLINKKNAGILKKITAKEYEVLGPYLTKPSLVTAGASV